MAVKILEVKKESCPATRLIGKKYEGRANWGGTYCRWYAGILDWHVLSG